MDSETKKYVGIIVIAAVAYAVWHFQSDVYNVKKPYRSDEYAFSMLYPKSWEVAKKVPGAGEDTENVAVAFLSPRSKYVRENVVVIALSPRERGAEDDDGPMASYLEGVGQDAAYGFKVMERGRGELNGRPAEWAVYKAEIAAGKGDMYAQCLTYMVYGEKHLYVIICYTAALDFGPRRAVFEKMIRSFEAA